MHVNSCKNHKNFFFKFYDNLCKYHRQTDKHIKSIVRNLTKRTSRYSDCAYSQCCCQSLGDLLRVSLSVGSRVVFLTCWWVRSWMLLLLACPVSFGWMRCPSWLWRRLLSFAFLCCRRLWAEIIARKMKFNHF